MCYPSRPLRWPRCRVVSLRMGSLAVPGGNLGGAGKPIVARKVPATVFRGNASAKARRDLFGPGLPPLHGWLFPAVQDTGIPCLARKSTARRGLEVDGEIALGRMSQAPTLYPRAGGGFRRLYFAAGSDPNLPSRGSPEPCPVGQRFRRLK